MPHTHRPRPPQSDLSPDLNDGERAELEALLDALPAPLEPLDVSALDGFLVGVLLQPQPVPTAQWLRFVHDIEGRPVPPGLDLTVLQALVQRRHAALERCIAGRQWFDPWVFELEPTSPDDEADPSDVVLPWVAGFSAALDQFPALLAQASESTREPLAVLFRHFDPDDLEDVDDLLELMESLEPPTSVADAVEDLVRSTLLLADETRPRTHPAAAGRRPSGGQPPRRERRHRN